MYTYVYTSIHMFLHVDIHIHIHIYIVYACTHVFVYVWYIYIYIHIQLILLFSVHMCATCILETQSRTLARISSSLPSKPPAATATASMPRTTLLWKRSQRPELLKTVDASFYLSIFT